MRARADVQEHSADGFRAAVTAAAAARGTAPPADPSIRRVVLVEGDSDAAAVEAFATTLGRDLTREGLVVVSMGGATNFPRFLAVVGPAGLDLPLAGLCDAPEVPLYRRSLAAAGVVTDDDLGREGFFACVRDLEDELIRALGETAVVEVIGEIGDGPAFERMRRQPAQRDRALALQLHRFAGTAAGRKERLAGAIARRIPPGDIPEPIAGLLRYTAQG